MTWLILLAVGVAAVIAIRRRTSRIPSPPTDDILAPEQLNSQFERARQVVGAYGSIIESASQELLPESRLPASRDEIKSSILKVLAVRSLNGDATPEIIANCRACYAYLSRFVDAELAAQSASFQTALDMARDPTFKDDSVRQRASLKLIASASRAGAIGGQAEEYVKLASEFDRRWRAMSAVAAEGGTA